MDLGQLDAGVWGGGIALVLAVLQLLAHRRLDLGGATVAAGAATWLLAGAPAPLAAGLMSAAALLAAIAWWRGAARGVGRPELTGAVLALAVVGAQAVAWVPAVAPVDADRVRWGATAAVALLGAVSVLLALERRGLRGQRVYHYREIPVQPAGARPEQAAGQA